MMNLGRVRDFLRECLADERIRLGIYRTGRVIQNEDLRLFQQRTRNAESLLLTAGNIRAALLNVGVIPIRQLLDEFIRLCQTAYALELLVRSRFRRPSEDFP